MRSLSELLRVQPFMLCAEMLCACVPTRPLRNRLRSYDSRRRRSVIGRLLPAEGGDTFLGRNTICLSRLNFIRCRRRQALIDHGAADCEVIQALPGVILDSEHGMHFIIEKAADPRGALFDGFGFKIERLAEHAAFPEKMAVTPWLLHGDFEVCEHPQRKAGIGGDILVTTDQLCHRA